VQTEMPESPAAGKPVRPRSLACVPYNMGGGLDAGNRPSQVQRTAGVFACVRRRPPVRERNKIAPYAAEADRTSRGCISGHGIRPPPDPAWPEAERGNLT